MKNIIYEIKNLSYKYPKTETKVYENLNLQINSAEKWAIIGPSGCGKSTLLHLLSGILKPDEGQILFCNKNLTKPNNQIQIILQQYGLFPWKNVWQNIELPIKFTEKNKTLRKEKVQTIINSFGLTNLETRYPYELSGGQRQRVAIARATITSPKVLLMDEPFSALDAITREKFQIYVKNLTEKEKITTILVTHQIQEAVNMSENIILFDKLNSKPQIFKNIPKESQDKMEFYKFCNQIRTKLQEGEKCNENNQ